MRSVFCWMHYIVARLDDFGMIRKVDRSIHQDLLSLNWRLSLSLSFQIFHLQEQLHLSRANCVKQELTGVVLVGSR